MTTAPALFNTRALLVPWTVRDITDLWGATGTSFHDGDTFNALIDRGEGDLLLTHVRPAGYNAPEVYGDTKPAGEAAAAYVRTLVDTGAMVTIDSAQFVDSHEEDDFGRVLGAVTLADGRDLCSLMIDSGHAVADPGPA